MTHWKVRLCMVLRYLEFVWYWCACASQRIQATLTRSNPRVQLQSAGWIFRMKFVLLLTSAAKISWSVSGGMSPLNICLGSYVFPSRIVLKNDSKVRTDCETARRRGGSGRRRGIGKHPATCVVAEKIWPSRLPTFSTAAWFPITYCTWLQFQHHYVWKEKRLEFLLRVFLQCRNWFQVKYFMGFLPEGDEGLAAGGWWIIWRQEN